MITRGKHDWHMDQPYLSWLVSIYFNILKPIQNVLYFADSFSKMKIICLKIPRHHTAPKSFPFTDLSSIFIKNLVILLLDDLWRCFIISLFIEMWFQLHQIVYCFRERYSTMPHAENKFDISVLIVCVRHIYWYQPLLCKARVIMMTWSNANIFRVTGPCVGNSVVTVEFPSQGQWRGDFMFSWSAPD